MSMQTQYLLEFDEFRLDLAEKRLTRGDTVISITPKVFETLQVLVENAGRLVEKDELMQRIWQDRFVEESNLSFNIKMLRKALGDDAASPKFVETVPRRGYRFVAEVRKRAIEKESLNGTTPLVSPPVEYKPASSRPSGFGLTGLIVFLIAAVGGGWWYAGKNGTEISTPILTTPFGSENLSTNGRVGLAAVSPDGKNVAYTSGLGSDKPSVWLRQLDPLNNVQIIPPSDEFYYNLTFSPDGNFLYFVRGPKPGNPAEQYAIYRISIFGGVATKIVDEVQGWMSVSPNGNMLSFVRCYRTEDEWCSLWVADAADGKNERKLVSRPSPFRIGDNKISPDGRKIAFASGQSRDGSNEFDLSEVDIESGVERELPGERFFDIKRLLWLPGQRELLFTALRFPDKHTRIWRTSIETGEAEALTKDPEDYYGLSLDQNATVLVATQMRPDFYLSLSSPRDMTLRRVLGDVSTAAFAPDGKLIVTSGRQGNSDIWKINADGGVERQLTNDHLDDSEAVVSADGASIFFASNRTGVTQIWRMRADGTDQTQITTIEGGAPRGISPDGKWLYYHSAMGRGLRRVSVSDSAEQTIVDKFRLDFAVSPDCTQAAFADSSDGQARLVLVSLPDGHIVRTYKIGDDKPRIVGMDWSSDGKTLFYISAINDYQDNTLWAQVLDVSTPRKIGDILEEGVRNFAVSPDGASFAVVQGSWKHDAVLIKGLK